MKKVLSLVLALAMVLGMSTMAFAAAVGEITASEVIVVNAGQIEQGGSFSLPTTLAVTNLLVTRGALAYDDMSGSATNIAAISGTPTLSVSGSVGSPAIATLGVKVSSTATIGAGYSVDIDFTDAAATTNIVTVTLNFDVIAATTTPDPGSSTTTTTNVPTTWKIDGISPDWYLYAPTNIDDDDFISGGTVTEDMDCEIKLTANMFTWTNPSKVEGQAPEAAWANSQVRSSQLSNVGVRKTNPKNNSGTVKTVEIDGATILVETVTYFLKCGETDVSFDIDLTYKSKASGNKVAYYFTIANEQVLMEDGQDYVETTDPCYVKADVSLRNVEMYIGEDLYLTKSFGSGQKAYAHVSLELSAGDENLFMQFPELSDVYTLYTVGVNSANVTAYFDLGDVYFVYDENYKLVGTTADSKLPFSNKYYLTTAKVDLTGGEEVEDPAESESVPEDTDNVDSGGGSTAVTNYNPNTN